MSPKAKAPGSGEIDGVQYRRATTLQIILYACNSLVGMSAYSLINMASYSASVGYGIATATVGVILACTRILDGVTDPLLALLYDRVNTRHGKIRILLITGYVIEAIGLLCMFNFFSSKGFGWGMFTLMYVIYVIGYTISNMTAQTIPSLLTNDPRQRPVLGVWNTAGNYLVPMFLSMVLNVVLLPMVGGEYNQTFLSTACWICLACGAAGTLLVCIGVKDIDKPENFIGTEKKSKPLNIKDMLEVLRYNHPLQCYIASATTDKIAQQVGSQAIINTLLSGILIGNMSLATILSVISMLPSILFAAVGARYAGKYGSRRGIFFWSCVSIGIAIVSFIFFLVIEPSSIATMGLTMMLYVILTLLQNGSNMCITTCNTSFMSDMIDYEMDRSGRYIPAVVTGTSSLIDKVITSLSAVIATGAVALIGYTTTMPQPGDPSTPAVFWLVMAIKFGLPIIGWIVNLIAMHLCHLTREEMVNVQKRIADKKAALKQAETATQSA